MLTRGTAMVMHIDTSAEPAKATTIYDDGNGRSFVEQTETQEELNKLFSFRTSYNTVQQKPSCQVAAVICSITV